MALKVIKFLHLLLNCSQFFSLAAKDKKQVEQGLASMSFNLLKLPSRLPLGQNFDESGQILV